VVGDRPAGDRVQHQPVHPQLAEVARRRRGDLVGLDVARVELDRALQILDGLEDQEALAVHRARELARAQLLDQVDLGGPLARRLPPAGCRRRCRGHLQRGPGADQVVGVVVADAEQVRVVRHLVAGAVAQLAADLEAVRGDLADR
jgi:hypothetical protein